MGLSQADSALRRGLGAIKVIGSYYNVYRLGDNNSASLISAQNLVISNFPARIVPGLPKALLEIEPIYKLVYNCICDTRSLKIGDCLVEVGPVTTDSPDGRTFILADVQPLLPAQAPRTEIMGTISRPASGATDPIQGRGAYQGTTKYNELIVVLDNGLYDITNAGTAAVIPMGIQPYTRMGPAQDFKFPTATHRSIHFIYIPLLPGFQVQPGDITSDQNGNRFRIQNVSSFTTGLQGTIAIAETLFV
jgi:hypothetical protein